MVSTNTGREKERNEKKKKIHKDNKEVEEKRWSHSGACFFFCFPLWMNKILAVVAINATLFYYADQLQRKDCRRCYWLWNQNRLLPILGCNIWMDAWIIDDFFYNILVTANAIYFFPDPYFFCCCYPSISHLTAIRYISPVRAVYGIFPEFFFFFLSFSVFIRQEYGTKKKRITATTTTIELRVCVRMKFHCSNLPLLLPYTKKNYPGTQL